MILVALQQWGGPQRAATRRTVDACRVRITDRPVHVGFVNTAAKSSRPTSASSRPGKDPDVRPIEERPMDASWIHTRWTG